MSEVDKENERSLSGVLRRNDYEKVEPILKVLEEKGYITPKEAQKVCDKSAATVRRYLSILTDANMVISEGNTNNTIYKVTDSGALILKED